MTDAYTQQPEPFSRKEKIVLGGIVSIILAGGMVLNEFEGQDRERRHEEQRGKSQAAIQAARNTPPTYLSGIVKQVRFDEDLVWNDLYFSVEADGTLRSYEVATCGKNCDSLGTLLRSGDRIKLQFGYSGVGTITQSPDDETIRMDQIVEINGNRPK